MNTELFAAKNLPFRVAMMVEEAATPLRSAAAVGSAVTGGLYVVVGALAICRRVLRLPELPADIVSLSGCECVLIVVGRAVIAGCVSPGGALGYRTVYLLLAMPGLLTLAFDH